MLVVNRVKTISLWTKNYIIVICLISNKNGKDEVHRLELKIPCLKSNFTPYFKYLKIFDKTSRYHFRNFNDDILLQSENYILTEILSFKYFILTVSLQTQSHPSLSVLSDLNCKHGSVLMFLDEFINTMVIGNNEGSSYFCFLYTLSCHTTNCISSPS